MTNESTGRVGVVVATHERREKMLATLERLASLPEHPPIVVVDNGSSDGTLAAVRAARPEVTLVALPDNAGAAGRNAGVREIEAPYVAFSDDDSWWDAGALELAARAFDAYPRLGLIAARILVGKHGRLDPTCAQMRRSPLPPQTDLPGPPVLGFVACGAVVRRSAFLQAGGFEPRLGMGAEEHLLALDMAAAGWGLAYVDSVVARHFPDGDGHRGRDTAVLRNLLWAAWLRRPMKSALRQTARLTLASLRDGAPMALLEALAGLRWVVGERRVVPDGVDRAAATLEARGASR